MKDTQSIIALTIVFLTLAISIYRVVNKWRPTNKDCNGGCSCSFSKKNKL